MLDIKGKTISILGLQRSGLAAAQLALKLGGSPKLSDLSPSDKCPPETLRWIKENNIPVAFDGHPRNFIEGSDVIVLSPGVRHDCAPVQLARSLGILVLGEIEFAFQFCQAPVIAVTGSNGKTTVVTLMDLVLERAGFKSALCGNVGMPFSNYVTEAYDYIVLEVSSFQLESMLDVSQYKNKEWKGFKPHVAALLNFSQNHLDRHSDLNEYLHAKLRIFENQDKGDFTVLNAQNSHLKNHLKDSTAQISFFNNFPNDEFPHNQNFSAVSQMANILGISKQICEDVFASFSGVEHRMERVRTINGIDFVNDSKSTTTEASQWALNNIQQPIHMICGGRDKNLDFSTLSEIVKQKVSKMYVYGEAKEKIRDAYKNIIDIEEFSALNEAVAKARHSAKEGDCVILSPMCASFDMFKDYEERGRVFKEIVEKLT